MTLAPDGSVAVTGQASRGFLDWYTVAFEPAGQVRWEAVRDGGLNTDEIPRAVLVRADGTTVVTGPGGPNLPGGFIPGVTAGYDVNGTLVWEAFSALATVWAVALPDGNVCATGGYDALITCWHVPDAGGQSPPAAPANLTATASSGGSIVLKWVNGNIAQSSVRIERCAGSGCVNFIEIAAVAGTATSYTNTGLTPRTVYRYRIRAHNAAGDSAYSNTASARAKR